MPFKAWEESSSNDEFVPWVAEFVQKNPETVGEIYDVSTIKFRKKGLIVETKGFAVWVFKSKQLHGHLQTYVEAWERSKEASTALQVKLTEEEPFYMLGEDEERQTYWTKDNEQDFRQVYKTVKDNPQKFPLSLPKSHPPTSEQSKATPRTRGTAKRKDSQRLQEAPGSSPNEE